MKRSYLCTDEMELVLHQLTSIQRDVGIRHGDFARWLQERIRVMLVTQRLAVAASGKRSYPPTLTTITAGRPHERERIACLPHAILRGHAGNNGRHHASLSGVTRCEAVQSEVTLSGNVQGPWNATRRKAPPSAWQVDTFHGGALLRHRAAPCTEQYHK